MAYSFPDAKAADRHETQYFEMAGNRGIYHKGWTAVTRHSTPWLLMGEKVPAFDEDNWSFTTPRKTGVRQTTWRPKCPRSCASCSGSG